jgi:hypothetical protein
MTVTLNEFMKDFTPKEQAKVKARLRPITEFPNREAVAIALADIAGHQPLSHLAAGQRHLPRQRLDGR